MLEEFFLWVKSIFSPLGQNIKLVSVCLFFTYTHPSLLIFALSGDPYKFHAFSYYLKHEHYPPASRTFHEAKPNYLSRDLYFFPQQEIQM